ncbi:MAG: hypothetical protein RR376_27130, partial [Janthinobacterium sp.]
EPGLTAGGPAFFARRALLNIKRGLSLDMTRDTWRILSGSYDGACLSSLALHGQRDQACITSRKHGWVGTARAFTPRLQEFGDGLGPTAPALQAFDTSVGKLCRGGTRLRLYINPTHALTLDALYWRGKWDAMEQWQRDLAQLAQRHRSEGCDVRVYDFSGFNSITSEPIPQVTGKREMRYYWEASHYRDNVGHFILARLFGGELPVPADFGVELTEGSIAAHQAAMRAARERYRVEHAREVAYTQRVLDGPLIRR